MRKYGSHRVSLFSPAGEYRQESRWCAARLRARLHQRHLNRQEKFAFVYSFGRLCLLCTPYIYCNCHRMAQTLRPLRCRLHFNMLCPSGHHYSNRSFFRARPATAHSTIRRYGKQASSISYALTAPSCQPPNLNVTSRPSSVDPPSRAPVSSMSWRILSIYSPAPER